MPRRSVPDAVFDQLVADIVDGELEADSPLPSERRLAEVLGVSRPAVREALQRLAQGGLVHTRHGEGTVVRDFRQTAGPELLSRLLLRGGELDLEVARSILEARQAIGPEVARLAALRATPAEVVRLHEAVAALEAAEDDAGRQRHALLLWEALVDASGNIAFRLMFNALRRAYEPVLDALAPVMAAEVRQIDAYDGLVDDIERGDPDAARRHAENLLDRGTRALLDAIDDLLTDGTETS